MTDIVTAITSILAVELGTIGTTDVTLGAVVLYVVLFSLAFMFYRKARGRG